MRVLKKFMCILMSIAVSGIIINFPLKTSAVPSFYTNEESKVYCSATLEDDFMDNEIIIVLANDSSLNAHTYTVADFPEIECSEVLDLTAPLLKKITEQKSNLCVSHESDELIIETETFNRILKLTILNAGKINVLNAIKKLEKRSDVLSADPSYIIEIASTEPNDPCYQKDMQWAVDKIQLPKAWDIATGSNTVSVGIIDSGIDADHHDLINRVDTNLSKSFGGSNIDPLVDESGHGTKVAGIIGAEGNNSKSIVGVCWNVNLVSLSIVDKSGILQTSYAIEAIIYATTNNIPILNLSGGIEGENMEQINSMFQAIQNYPGLFVCSAGNDDLNNDLYPHYPSNFRLPNLISVGASTSDDEKRDDSNYGAATVDIFAPGDNIHTTTKDGYTVYSSGTSFAAPYVAGVAALLLSEHPTLTASELKQYIIGGIDIAFDDNGDSVFEYLCVSGGRLNAYNSLCVMRAEHSYKYSYTSSSLSHTVTCSACSHTFTEPHKWVTQGSLIRCTICGKTTEKAPIIMQSIIPVAFDEEETTQG